MGLWYEKGKDGMKYLYAGLVWTGTLFGLFAVLAVLTACKENGKARKGK